MDQKKVLKYFKKINIKDIPAFPGRYETYQSMNINNDIRLLEQYYTQSELQNYFSYIKTYRDNETQKFMEKTEIDLYISQTTNNLNNFRKIYGTTKDDNFVFVEKIEKKEEKLNRNLINQLILMYIMGWQKYKIKINDFNFTVKTYDKDINLVYIINEKKYIIKTKQVIILTNHNIECFYKNIYFPIGKLKKHSMSKNFRAFLGFDKNISIEGMLDFTEIKPSEYEEYENTILFYKCICENFYISDDLKLNKMILDRLDKPSEKISDVLLEDIKKYKKFLSYAINNSIEKTPFPQKIKNNLEIKDKDVIFYVENFPRLTFNEEKMDFKTADLKAIKKFITDKTNGVYNYKYINFFDKISIKQYMIYMSDKKSASGKFIRDLGVCKNKVMIFIDLLKYHSNLYMNDVDNMNVKDTRVLIDINSFIFDDNNGFLLMKV